MATNRASLRVRSITARFDAMRGSSRCRAVDRWSSFSIHFRPFTPMPNYRSDASTAVIPGVGASGRALP
jgi:hypothetical protein